MLVQNSAPGNRRQTSMMKPIVSLRSFSPFAGKSKNDVEGWTNAGLKATRRALIDGSEILKVLVHQPSEPWASRIHALADLVEAAAAQQLQIFEREARSEIRRGLNAPFEVAVGADQAFRDSSRSIQVNQEVIVDDPQHLQVVSAVRSTVSSTNCSAGKAFHLRP